MSKHRYRVVIRGQPENIVVTNDHPSVLPYASTWLINRSSPVAVTEIVSVAGVAWNDIPFQDPDGDDSGRRFGRFVSSVRNGKNITQAIAIHSDLTLDDFEIEVIDA